MKNISENNLIRFISITKKKDGCFANFKVKGIKNGTAFSASITVDFTAVDVTPADTLEHIIEKCAKAAEKEFKQSELQYQEAI